MFTEKMNGWKMWMSVMLASGLLFGGMITPVIAAVEEHPAASPQSTVPGDGLKHFFEGVLNRTFRYQKSMTAFIGAALEDAGSSMLRAEERIDKLVEDEKDAAGLEEALSQFEILIEEAENAYSAAQSLVDLHSGFNDQGRVKDLEKARETINAIEPYLSTTRKNIVEAVRVVYEAVKAYQEN